MRILVVTTVHTPLDARIHRRQIGALVGHGHAVTYAAPFAATGTDPALAGVGVAVRDLPRAVGRRRLGPLRAARRLLRREGARHDVILLHDPELVLAIAGRRRRLPPVVLDVHEDTAAALIDRPWVPAPARAVLAACVRAAERWAERHLHLLLAEASYQQRFVRPHPFVPNVPPLPDAAPPASGDDRVVYVGRVARSRGAVEVLAAAARRSERYRFELYGPADADVRDAVEAAVAAGHVTWHGFVPNARALEAVGGAMAGLSLVHPQPNHAGSLQTKVLEYLSRRVPVISTDLPVTGPFLREVDAGLTVPAGDVDAVVAALDALAADPARRLAMGDRGYAEVVRERNWQVAGRRFVAVLTDVVADRPRATRARQVRRG